MTLGKWGKHVHDVFMTAADEINDDAAWQRAEIRRLEREATARKLARS
jgi:hypothetical protein